MKDYKEILHENREDMINTLRTLISIKSIVEKPENGAPFGLGVKKAFDYMMNKSETMGFSIFDANSFGGHAEIGQGDEVMGILVHLDTVPEGDGWSCDPFEGMIKDGKLYGRGSSDDKGPAVAAMYAMKALQEAGADFQKRVRLIFGLDEEVGEWEGIVKYLEAAGKPDFGFTPDADFPLVQAEMGILVFDLVKKFEKTPKKGLTLKSISGGTAYNMVPNACVAVLSGDSYDDIKNKLIAFRDKTGYKISSKGRGRSLEITTEGLSAHGAKPFQGVNAISIMMLFLAELTFESESVNDFIKFYSEKIGMELHGVSIGCGFSDEISGALIWNTGIINVDDEAGRITINVRYPVTMYAEDVYNALAPALDDFGFGIVKEAHKKPIYIPKDHFVIKTLLEVYQENTGDYDTKPLVIGGGTYARAIDNAVGFGIKFPNQPSTEHQKDEYIEIDNWMKSAEIFADAIYRLACK